MFAYLGSIDEALGLLRQQYDASMQPRQHGVPVWVRRGDKLGKTCIAVQSRDDVPHIGWRYSSGGRGAACTSSVMRREIGQSERAACTRVGEDSVVWLHKWQNVPGGLRPWQGSAPFQEL